MASALNFSLVPTSSVAPVGCNWIDTGVGGGIGVGGGEELLLLLQPVKNSSDNKTELN